MIIFGTRGITSTTAQGSFQCPRCRDKRSYELKKVRRWFTLYFIPVFPIESGTEYVECGLCRGTYELVVLQQRLEPSKDTTADEYRRAVARSLAWVIARSGIPRPEAFTAAGEAYRAATTNSLPDGAFRQELLSIAAGTLNVPKYLEKVAPLFDPLQKEKLVLATAHAAQSCGAVDLITDEGMTSVAAALQVTPSHLKGLLGGLSPAASA